MQGTIFGRLTVLGPDGKNKYKATLWRCQCSCGQQTTVPQARLTSGTTKSCGCYRKEFRRTHGASATRDYASWRGMLDRCENVNHPAYARYGGRGITVCRRWHKYANFSADMGPRPKGMTIDRIDNKKGYTPVNVRWATRSEQMQNVRHNLNIRHHGQVLSLGAWARKTGIAAKTISGRWHAGHRGARLFARPKTHAERGREQSTMLTFAGTTLPLSAWAEKQGIKSGTLHYRLRNGWSVKDALMTPVRGKD